VTRSVGCSQHMADRGIPISLEWRVFTYIFIALLRHFGPTRHPSQNVNERACLILLVPLPMRPNGEGNGVYALNVFRAQLLY